MTTARRGATGLLGGVFLFLAVSGGAETPAYQSELLFAPMALHNHGSSIVECPNGDLLVSWYRGSGERSADNVEIVGARRRRGKSAWSPPFPMADTPGFPDCNASLIIDPQKRLWLFWPLILANKWESALLKVKISKVYQKREGEPEWETDTVVHLKPGPEFLETVQRDLDRQWEPYLRAASPADQQRLQALRTQVLQQAADKLSVRLGWMPRPHPFILDNKRLIVPLYSDGFNFSLMAITDDWGKTWKTSTPLVGAGNVQPSVVLRKDGTLVAYFRDNGPAPKRVMVCESSDGGMNWTLARDTELFDPGAGVEAIVLKSGRWLLINNNTERGRHRLALSISEDEGKTWPRVAYLEQDEPGEGAGSYHYPSIIQARDGTIHVSYSITVNRAEAARLGAGESIKHAQFNEAWLLSKAVSR
jgi:predicted neuraminidase